MAKTRKEASDGPKVEKSGTWYTITTADGEEHKVQGEEAKDAKLAELAGGTSTVDVEEDYDDPPEPGTEEDRPTTDEEIEQAEADREDAIPAGVRARQPGAESVEEQEDEDDEPEPVRLAREDDERRKELEELTPEEAHARQARRSNEAGAARTRRPVVPGPKSDTVLARTAEEKDVPEDIEEDSERDPDQIGTAGVHDAQTALDARGYQTANDGRGPFTAESLGPDAAERRDEDRERREKLAEMTPEERQEFLVEEAEERESDKPEVARKPALRAALDDTIEPNISQRSGIPTGPANHPPIAPSAPSTADKGNTLHGWSAQQKTVALLERSTDEDDES